MRILLLVAGLVFTGLAFADDTSAAAYGDFQTCVRVKATSYARVEGSLTEVATAALAACAKLKFDLKKALLIEYQAEGKPYEDAVASAVALVDSLAEDELKGAMATVAEARLPKP